MSGDESQIESLSQQCSRMITGSPTLLVGLGSTSSPPGQSA
ncbi:hypothetical protein [Flexivirga endophytica]|nr:hypothetical protein [Flexivirga endophytica]